MVESLDSIMFGVQQIIAFGFILPEDFGANGDGVASALENVPSRGNFLRIATAVEITS